MSRQAGRLNYRKAFRCWALFLTVCLLLLTAQTAAAQATIAILHDRLAKLGSMGFVKAVTDKFNIKYVAPKDRIATFGNSNDDEEMLKWTISGGSAPLGHLVLHDDPKLAYAYGPAEGLPDTMVGRFPQPLMDEAQKRCWVIISMKNEWKKIFAWE